MISRKKSFIIAGGIIAAFFIGVFILFKQRPSIVTPLGTASISIDAQSGPKLILNDFHRSETKNGKLIWEVHATEGSFSPSNQTAEVKKPVVRLMRKQGEVNLTSVTASLSFQGQTLTSAHLKEEVTLDQKNPPFSMRTNDAMFNQAEQSLIIPGEVTIISDTISVKGDGLVGDLEKGVFTINKNVRSVIFGKPQTTKEKTS